MKRAEEIFEAYKKEAEEKENPYAYYMAVGALIAHYDMLTEKYIDVKKELETLKDDTKRKSN